MAGVDDVEAFVAEGSDALLRYAYLLTGDRAKAQDLTQEALARVFEARRRVEPEGLAAYARKVMYNQNISWWRKVTSREASLPEETALPGISDGAAGRADREAVFAAVRALPHKARTAIVLYYYEDYTPAQIAEILDSSESSVRTLLTRGRAGIRQLLEPTLQEVQS